MRGRAPRPGVAARTAPRRHPPRASQPSAGTVVRRGVRLAATHRDLRRLLVATAAIGCGLSSIELLWQPRITGFLPTPDSDAWIFGLFGAAAFFFAAAGALVVARLTARVRPACAAAFGTFGYGLCFIGLASTGGVVPFGVAYAASYLFQSASGPYHRTLLHAGTPSAARATMLSVDSLALMAGGLVSNAVLSRVADATTSRPHGDSWPPSSSRRRFATAVSTRARCGRCHAGGDGT